ncbi:MAG: hypothetical protein ACFB11_16655 [Paracoccaceae bacterium]
MSLPNMISIRLRRFLVCGPPAMGGQMRCGFALAGRPGPILAAIQRPSVITGDVATTSFLPGQAVRARAWVKIKPVRRA